MSNPIGTGTYELAADRTQLQKDLAAAKQDVATSGSAAEKSFGQAFTALPTVKLGLQQVGAAAQQGFGLVKQGAIEAQAAQGNWQAQTGENAAQARQAMSEMDGLAGSAGTVGKSFAEISDVGANVENQFGTTGQATASLTNDFFNFAKVTGQDAKGAVLGINDAMTAFGEPASNATQDMDLLVASHQKFGTDVGPQTIQTLQNIAPALTQLGDNMQDGIALMNAFETQGLNSNTAMKDLTTVIKQFPPGTTLNDVITKMGAIHDDTQRANAIMDTFGPKLGPALAKVIQPGMTSLDEYKVSVDDAKGATQNAAQSMETDSEKIQGAMDKLTAGAREVGQDFGPALTGLSALGDMAGPLVSGGKKLFTTVAKDVGLLGAATAVGVAEGEAETAGSTGSSVLTGWLAKFGLMTGPKVAAAAAAGEAEGAAEGAASAEAMGGAGAVGAAGTSGAAVGAGFIGALGPIALMGAAGVGVLMLPMILDHLTGQDATSKIAGAGKQMADVFAAGSSDEVKSTYADKFESVYQAALQSGATYEAASVAGKASADAYLTSLGLGLGDHDSFRTIAQTASDEFEHDSTSGFTTAGYAAAHAAAAAAGAALGDHDSRAPLIAGSTEAAHAVASAFADKQIWDQSAQAITGDLAGTLEKGAETNIKSAMDKVTFAIDHPLALEHQKSEIEAALSSKKLATALASSNPEISTTARQQQQYLIGLWQQLTGQAWTDGNKASANLDDGLSSHYPDIKSGARGLVNDVNSIFDALQTHYSVQVAYHAGQIAKNDLPRFAEGGYLPARKMGWVGENGPEPVIFDAGATIAPSREWRSVFSRLATPSTSQPTQEVHYHEHFHIGTVVADRASLARLGSDIEEARGFNQRTRMPLAGAYGS